MTRVASPVISGSGSGKNASPKPCCSNRLREVVVEFLRDVARQFEVLLLVLADRHVGGAIDQNVGRHQRRIGVEADRGVLAVLAGLFLELRHAVEPAEPGDAIEDPGKLGVLGNLALVEHDVLLRIDAAGDERRGDFANGVRQFGRILPDRDRVQIDDAIDAVVAVLQFDEALDGAEIVAEMQIAGRLHAGKNQFLERHDFVSLRKTDADRVSNATASACPARGGRYSAPSRATGLSADRIPIMASARYDVLGIGNAIVDVIARAEEDFLLTQGMRKGAHGADRRGPRAGDL